MDASALAPLLARGLTSLQAQVATLSQAHAVLAVAGSARWTPAPDDPLAIVVAMDITRDGIRESLSAQVSAADPDVVLEGGEAITTTLATLLERVTGAESDVRNLSKQLGEATAAAEQAMLVATAAAEAAMALGEQVAELAALLEGPP